MNKQVEPYQIKGYLKKYERLYDERIELISAKSALIVSMQNAKAVEYSPIPHGSNGVKKDLSDYIIKLDRYYSRIGKLERAQEKLRKKYYKMFECLEENEAAVLKKRYIEFKDWNTIAKEMKKSRMQISRYHKKALEKMASYKKSKE